MHALKRGLFPGFCAWGYEPPTFQGPLTTSIDPWQRAARTRPLMWSGQFLFRLFYLCLSASGEKGGVHGHTRPFYHLC